MPRPKVHPAHRLRANTACTACRASKKRCSGTFPCSNCLNKGRGCSCTPFKSMADADLRSRPMPASRPTETTQIWDSQQSPLDQHSDSNTVTRLSEHSSPENMLEAGSRSPEATHRTHPRMLRNLQGERGMKYDQGLSHFSHNVKSEDMLETESHHDILNPSEDRYSIEDKRGFIQNYYVAQFFFARGQSRTFANLLEDPSMDLVRVFLLMAFYMLGSCRRNAAFMYLGVAARAAVALGLHADPSGPGNRHEQQERSILGRPSATASLLPENREGPGRMAIEPPDVGLVASYHLSLILDEIICRLYSEKAASPEMADFLLSRLNRWSERLPDTLRSSSLETENRAVVQEHTIGNMHVACSYHFAVILVTRPFLISTLSVRLAQLHQTLAASEPSEAPKEDPAHSRLAAACIDSAVYIAFVFAAALVLGFSMFSHRDVDAEIDGAFQGALTILRMLASQSAQAAHYLEILSLLESAVKQQRQRLTAHSRQRRSQYVRRIFRLTDPTTTTRTQGGNRGRPENSTLLATPGGSLYPWVPSDDTSCTVTPPVDGTFLDGEGMELPLWDSFPFLTEPSTILI
ncbi:hypothetical protein NUU61_004637 [Penicillium alfredii]|uniref:Zn(2)-C6 fungal-type domain-containing protein n=1 Tax=Penicillium alfredii TaxID=1506179 RepID=A0A9W9FLJ7_9EURO|nr:uncharacterized protein NUU61_004637 [Penicillium alfredii]KAJ5102415.1 hypothetical protein NUU61_004637 [Penicillium alfredii]